MFHPNTNNSMVEPDYVTQVDPVSDDILSTFRKIFLTVWLGLSLVGIFTNVVNIITFLKLGIKSSVTISFFSLAISDLFACIMDLVSSGTSAFGFIADNLNISLPVPSFVMILYFSYLRRAFSHTTILITVYLAFQRCLCVVMPFKVKGLFSLFRTYCYTVSITLFCLISHALWISRHHIIRENNSTEMRVQFLPGTEPYRIFYMVILNLMFSTGGPVIVFLCLLIMGAALRKSVEFRKSAVLPNNKHKENKDRDTPSGQRIQEKKQSKETQALVQVTLVSVVFVITNIPMLGFGLAIRLLPGFGLYLKYHNLSYLMLSIALTGELVNSSVNFFVYYKYNARFRKQCFSLVKKESS